MFSHMATEKGCDIQHQIKLDALQLWWYGW